MNYYRLHILLALYLGGVIGYMLREIQTIRIAFAATQDKKAKAYMVARFIVLEPLFWFYFGPKSLIMGE